ncbi:hypothetical protein [Streptomyces sp. NPDC048669]
MSRSSLSRQPDGVAHPVAVAVAATASAAALPAVPGREREPVNGRE